MNPVHNKMISKTNALHYDLQKSSALEDDLQKPMHYMMIWSTPLICSCKEGIRRSWSPPTASIWLMYIETCNQDALDLYISVIINIVILNGFV